MKNKIELKKCLVRVLAAILAFLILIGFLHLWEYRQYTYNYNKKVNQIISEVKRNYPEVSEAELIKILSEEDGSHFVDEKEEADDGTDIAYIEETIASKYGVDMKKDSLILANDRQFRWFLAFNIALAGLLAAAVLALFLRYNQKKDRELARITRYIEEINQKNYRLELDDMAEDELSILKTEIGKTTVMLKEAAEHSLQDKQNLKQSLSDISHQLKTPLTAISIILDNLIDDPDMDPEVRGDFIRDVKREITNINFLVQALLKLSRLDADAVVFIKEKVSLGKIVAEAIQKVSPLCDLRGVDIRVNQTEGDEIVCDVCWQVEAITNILKNAVEHSPRDSQVLIRLEVNSVYTAVSIRDFGPGIDPEDMKHLFERFYRGKNASKDSVGIGLALAKAIVESDRGHVSVKNCDPGSEFTVKYFK